MCRVVNIYLSVEGCIDDRDLCAYILNILFRTCIPHSKKKILYESRTVLFFFLVYDTQYTISMLVAFM